MAQDRRTRYTCMVLNESLVDLLQVKPLSKITVKELSSRSAINRSTYYRHFQDPYDQFEQLLQDFFAGVSRYIRGNSGDVWSRSSFDLTEKLCQYLYENRILYLVLLNASTQNQLEEKMRTVLPYVFDALSNQRVFIDEELRAYVFTYLSAATNSILKRWLEHDADRYTPQEIANLIHRINIGGISEISEEKCAL